MSPRLIQNMSVCQQQHGSLGLLMQLWVCLCAPVVPAHRRPQAVVLGHCHQGELGCSPQDPCQWSPPGPLLHWEPPAQRCCVRPTVPGLWGCGNGSQEVAWGQGSSSLPHPLLCRGGKRPCRWLCPIPLEALTPVWLPGHPAGPIPGTFPTPGSCEWAPCCIMGPPGPRRPSPNIPPAAHP